MTTHLTPEQLKTFEDDGLLVLRSFFDPEQQVLDIQRAIHAIVGLLLKKYGVAHQHAPFTPETFEDGYQALIAHDRKIGGEVYDAAKQIPAFLQFCAHPALIDLTRQIRQTDMPGIAAQGYGVRIDNPNEEQFRANWHQDYTSQFRSRDGLVFWTPLLAVTQAMGPVEFCLGSHKHGAIRVYDHDLRQPEKRGAYALTLEDEDQTVSAYETVAPLTQPGDLVIIDYMTVHRSGFNVSDRSRWSMQIRYFNYNEPSGIAHGWKGGIVSGVGINEVDPGLLIESGNDQ